MAYNSNIKIIPGDIIFETTQAGIEVFPFSIMARTFCSENIVSAVKVPPTLTTNQYPCIRNAVGISPNGRYIVYSSGTYGSYSPNGLTIWDLDDNTFTTFGSVGFLHRFYFTEDSTTMLVASNTTPFAYAFDLTNKIAKGTITGAPTFANMTLKAAAYGNYIYCIATGTGATGELYRYDKTTNAMTAMGIAHAFAFSDISIDKVKGYVFLSNGSSGTGRYLNIYDLNSIGTTPAQLTNSIFVGCTNSVVSPLGFFACAQLSSNALKVGKLTYGASVTATTIADVSPATGFTVSSTGLIAMYIYDNVLFALVGTPPNAYPNIVGHIRTIDFNAYTSGAVVPVINPGTNNDISAYCVHPSFARRKFAGHVYDASSVGVARELEAIERSTNRVVGTVTSSAVDGSFTMPVYTTAQCIVVAKGSGSENSKLADYVAPVSV